MVKLEQMRVLMQDQSVLILGLGKTGKEVALLFKEKGAKVEITEIAENQRILRRKKELELKGIKVFIGPHEKVLLKNKTLLVLSPGVRLDLPIVKKARSMGIPVIGELEIITRFIPKENLIAITGTNGKTTTSFLTYKILKKSKANVKLGGNIGIPLSRLIRTSNFNDPSFKIVMEVSSFQLETTDNFSPHIYAILNVAPDHLDRHFSMERYLNIKSSPLTRMSSDDVAILNCDQDQVAHLAKLTEAKVIFFSHRKNPEANLFIDNKSLVANIGGHFVRIYIGDLDLKKFHSLDNLLCAVGIALIEGIDAEIVHKALVEYKPLAHRQQLIAKIKGVNFIDDSKATNEAAVEALIKTLDTPAILIMGGRDKGGDFSSLRKYFPGNVKGIVLIGEAKDKIRRQLEGTFPIRDCRTLGEAVRVSFSWSKKGDAVVLCPGCSSFDEFSSYKERGNKFKEEVKKLKEEIERKISG